MVLSLQWNQGPMAADLVLAASGLQTDDGLEAAVLLSLFCDARASDDDPVPAGADRRGYWADALAQRKADLTGSKIWLAVEKGKRDPRTLQLVRAYALASLAWMTDEGLADTVEATAELDQGAEYIVLAVTITGPAAEANPWTGVWRLRLGI